VANGENYTLTLRGRFLGNWIWIEELYSICNGVTIYPKHNKSVKVELTLHQNLDFRQLFGYEKTTA
jgi:hypothetical protein